MTNEQCTGTLIADLQQLVTLHMGLIKAQQDFIALTIYPPVMLSPEAEDDMERDRR